MSRKETGEPLFPSLEKEPAERLVALLLGRGLHIAFAESCTGGLLAAGLVAVPGASGVLDASLVTYANEAKTYHLGVLPETLAAHGAVSEEVAGEMAAGVAALTSAEIGVAVSGIAGPDGGTEKKPVGTVCFGFSVLGKVRTETLRFGSLGRAGVRAAAVRHVYESLIAALDDEAK